MAWARTSVKVPFALGDIVGRIHPDRFNKDVAFRGVVHAERLLHSGKELVGPGGRWLGPSCSNHGDPGEPPDATGQTFGRFPALTIPSILAMPWKRGQALLVLEYGRLALHDGTGFRLSITCRLRRSGNDVVLETDAEPLATVHWKGDGEETFVHAAPVGGVLPSGARVAYVEDRLGNRSAEASL